jgi:hypothetical protein
VGKASLQRDIRIAIQGCFQRNKQPEKEIRGGEINLLLPMPV